MPRRDHRGKAVLVTGGTSGIGLATARAFGREGAQLYLTHRWGSGDEDAIRRSFAEDGSLPPRILEADVSADEDTERLMDRILEHHERLEVFVSNVAFAPLGRDPTKLSRSALTQGLRYSAWPFVRYLQRMKVRLGSYPRYVVGMSSPGSAYFLPGYDYVAVAKTVMETFCRYLTQHLAGEDVHVNVLRAWFVETPSLEATFGPEFAPFCKRYHGPDFFLQPEEVADCVRALCSGLMDSVRGQTLLLDRGLDFSDNVVRLFQHREQYGLS